MGVEFGKASPPKGMRVYAVGDVHGCLHEMKSLLHQISNDMMNNPVKKYRIIFVGDYMDRGPRSKGVVSHLLCLMARNPNIVCLRGNHDMALLNFLGDPYKYGPLFFRNGGTRTLRSFGVRVTPGTISETHMREVHAFSKQLINPSHLAFIANAPYSKTLGDYFFCHAGIRPGVALKKQKKRDLIWIRDEFLDHTKLHEKVIVHGHTAQDKVDVQRNRVNIDTRCHASGVLTCVVLEGTAHRFLQTKP